MSKSIEECLCPICKDIFVQPITTSCGHTFCLECFSMTFQNTTVFCALCKKRCGTWWRRAKNKEDLINVELWNIIQKNYKKYLENRNAGIENKFPVKNHSESPSGEIYQEYIKERDNYYKDVELARRQEEELSKSYIKNLLKEEAQLKTSETRTLKVPHERRKSARRQHSEKPAKPVVGPMDRHVNRELGSMSPVVTLFRPIDTPPKTPPKNEPKKMKFLKGNEEEPEKSLTKEEEAARLKQIQNDFALAKKLSRTDWDPAIVNTRRNSLLH